MSTYKKLNLIVTCLFILAGISYACNLTPIADIDSDPNSRCLGEVVSFDGSGSYDPDGGSIDAYVWVFPEGAYDISGSHTSTPSCKFSSAGTFDIKLKVLDDDDDWSVEYDTWTVTVVEVQSLLPDMGGEIEDNDPNTRTFVVCTAGSGDVTVTAAPNPKVTEANLPVCWSMTGGTGSGQLSRTVSLTSTGSTTISVTTCGTSNASTIIDVSADTDSDGMPDNWETHFGLNSSDPNDAALGIDTDGLTNLEEYQAGTDPNDNDTDDDGMDDDWEVDNFLDALVSSDNDLDLDYDGYTNLGEYLHSSDPNDAASTPSSNITIDVPSDASLIQLAINAAINGDTIEVAQGTYYEAIDLMGKSITLKGSDPDDWDVVNATVIDAEDMGPVVTFTGAEDPNCQLTGLTLTGGLAGQKDGLVAYWDMEDGSGTTATDGSGNTHDGTLTGGPIWDPNGYIGSALGFDGTDDYVLISGYKGVTGTQSRTVAAWIKTSAGGDIITWGDAVVKEKWRFRTDTTSSALYLQVHGGSIIATTDVCDGQWHHVAAVLQANYVTNCSEIKLYVDGQEEVVSSIAAYDIDTDDTVDVRIGAYLYGPNYFDGLIDEVRIYDRGLSANELAGLAGKGLVAQWKLDETTGSTASDSFDSKDGTLNDFAGDGSEWQRGVLGGGLDFDDVDDYVQIDGYKGILGGSSRTCTAWINIPDGYTEACDIISWGEHGVAGKRWRIRTETSGYLSAGIGGGGYVITETSLHTGTWQHIAIVSPSSSTDDILVYINGNLENFSKSSGTINTNGISDVLIGHYYGDAGGYFKGMIDDVRVYQIALSPDEVKHVYQTGAGIMGNGTTAEISKCVITENFSVNDGGGVSYVDGIISRCMITKNISESSGGGLSNCNATIINCVIAGNSSMSGGGLANCNNIIENCTIANNLAYQGGGLYDCSLASSILNTIIWANWADQNEQMYNAPDPDYSCIQDWTGSGTGNITDDPLFIDPNNYDYHLDPNSLGVDGGNPFSDYSAEPLANGGRVNIGAYGNTSEARTTIDSDSDGLSNPDEVRNGTGIFDSDSDDDGLTDGTEVHFYGSDPMDSDTDDDGMPDGWEANNGLYPTYSGDVDFDFDVDDSNSLSEYQNGTNPNDKDSDSDGMPDGWEDAYGLAPTDPNDADSDLDNDNYSNVVEYLHRTNPNNTNASILPITIIVPTDTSDIQFAIDGSIDGDIIEILPGTYEEVIDFEGKAITVRSSDPNDWDIVQSTIIDANSLIAVVTFDSGEDANSVLYGLTIRNGTYGISVSNSSSPSIRQCLIVDNDYGVYCSSAAALITGNKIADNTSSGIYASGSYLPEIRNNWLYGNDNAVYLSGATTACKISNNTLVDNGYGIYLDSGTMPEIENCIVWNSTTDDLYGCTATYSCIGDGDAGTGNISSDPNFVNPSDPNNPDYHLNPSSICVDSGDPNGTYSGLTDIDGNSRVHGLKVDMGADEIPATWYADVDASGTGDGTSLQNAFNNIQDAIDAALDADTIVVAEGTYTEAIDFLGKAVTVTGTDPGDWDAIAATIIDSNDVAATVAFTSGEGNDSVLEGLTITGDAVGIYCSDASPSIMHCLVKNNESYGMYCYSGSSEIRECRFVDNDNFGLKLYLSSAMVSNCVITGNAGGGISSGWPTIANCTIAYNDGYGIYSCQGLITNSIIWGNTSDSLYECVAMYSCLEDGDAGEDNTNYFPYFVDSSNGDFRLKTYSSCINSGDPGSDYSNEPNDLPGRINIGAYGNTLEAAIESDDSDNDGLPDAWELVHWPGDNPNLHDPNGDPDNDTLDNEMEYQIGTDPTDGDSDNDGLSDGWEYDNDYGWNDSDTDNDGMPDGWEYNNGLNALDSSDAGSDADGDGLSSLQEFNTGGNPNDTDTDNDGMPDGWEYIYGLSPSDPNDAEDDSDLDGYSNIAEYIHSSEPNDVSSFSEPMTIIVPTDISTIQEAIDWSITGDTIEVLPGTYYENLNFKGRAVTLQSTDPNEWDVISSTIIDANSIGTVLTFDSGEDANSIILGLRLTNGVNGIACSNSSSPMITRCIIENSGSHGINSSSGAPAIIGNRIRWNSADGVYSSANTPPVLRNNWVYGNSGKGLQFASATISGTVTNNTIVDNSQSGIYLASGTAPSVVNCILWGNDANDLEGCSATYSCVQDGDAGTGNISSDPNFINPNDPNDPDYHLEPGSSCIDVGYPDGAYTGLLDIDDESRVRGKEVDIGADEASVTWYVDVEATGSSNGFSLLDAFNTIQDGIDAADDDDKVLIAEGTYYETIDVEGKAITICSTDPYDWDVVEATIIDANDPNAAVITFDSNMNENSIVMGLTITGGLIGISCDNIASPTVTHSILKGNDYGLYCEYTYNPETVLPSPVFINCLVCENSKAGIIGGVVTLTSCTIANNGGYGVVSSYKAIENCIIWDNAYPTSLYAPYSCVEGGSAAEGGIGYMPYFTDPNGGDFHLQDYSPCIDTGDPNLYYSNEPNGGGSRINMGAYGNTSEATLASSDSDSDEIPDTWETLHWPSDDPNMHDPNDDPDSDALSNLIEYQIGTDPNDSDTDDDGMPDGWEDQYNLKPYNAVDAQQDNDGDGLTNLQEYTHSSDPTDSDEDSDSDGLPDAWEYYYWPNDALTVHSPAQDTDVDDANNLIEYNIGTDPSDADTDNDGMEDGWEYTYGFDPLDSSDASQDADNDGLSNLGEYTNSTDPTDADSDDDKMLDGWEVTHQLNPLSNDADSDFDQDSQGYSNYLEYLHGSDPNDSTSNPVDVITITVPIDADTIQKGIDYSVDGDTILVLPGVYNESVDFDGKAITVTGKDSGDWQTVAMTIIDGKNKNQCVIFENSEGNDSELIGVTLTVTDGGGNNGIYCNGASPTIRQCIIEENGLDGINVNSGSPIITNNMVGLNGGDGIDSSATTPPTIVNNWIYGNGVMGIRFASATSASIVRNNTITDNDDDGISVDSGTVPTVSNCIFWGNTNSDLDNCSATYSCIEDGDSGTGNISSNPQFIDSTNYDYSLDRTSPCIDAGNGTYSTETDIFGQVREADTIDMGADEVCVIHNSTQDIWYTTDGIQDAIDAASSNDTIVIYEWTFTENIDFDGKSITLTGSDPYNWDIVEDTIIQASSTSTPVVTFDSNEDPNAVLTGFTICDAATSYGVYCSGTSPQITRCVIEDNDKGAYCASGSPLVAQNKIRNNTTGIASDSTDALVIRSNWVYDNETGLSFNTADESVEVYNNSILFNTTTQEEGIGVYVNPNTTEPVIANSIIWGNNDDLQGCLATYSCISDTEDLGTFDVTHNISGDPMFMEVEEDLFYLSNESPCIGMGNPNIIPEGALGLEGSPIVKDLTSEYAFNYFYPGEGLFNKTEAMMFLLLATAESSGTNLKADSGGSVSMCWYVDRSASSGGSGETWEDAFNCLQDALSSNSVKDGHIIYLAEGIYKPTTGANREISFILNKSIELYGGFLKSGSEFSERNPKRYKTVLSGDIGVESDSTDNSFTVVLIESPNCLIDGIRIVDGYASGSLSGSWYYSRGGGVYCNDYSASIVGCTFQNNYATSDGGAVFQESLDLPYYQSLLIKDCVFEDNLSIRNGGAVCSYGTPIHNEFGAAACIVNCSFSDNSADKGGAIAYSKVQGTWNIYNNDMGDIEGCFFQGNFGMEGGAVCVDYSSIHITNCVFADQIAENGGAIAFFGMEEGHLGDYPNQISESTFTSNSATNGGALYIYDYDGDNSITYNTYLDVTACILWGDSAIEGYLNTKELSFASPNEHTQHQNECINITYSVIQGGYTGTGNINQDPLFVDAENEDYKLQANSPCIDSGGPIQDRWNDIRGFLRVVGQSVDMGAYESWDDSDTVNTDNDNDGMPDNWELATGLNPDDPTDATKDTDGDGVKNIEEYLRGTYPQIDDSDGDGISDGDEMIVYGTSPLKFHEDVDEDGIPDVLDRDKENGPTLNSEPLISMSLSPAPVNGVLYSDTVTITANVTKQNSVDIFMVKINGAYTLEDESIEGKYTRTYSNLSDIPRRFTVRATTVEGLTVAKTVDVTVNADPPDITFKAPQSKATIEGHFAFVRAKLSEPLAKEACEFRISDTSVTDFASANTVPATRTAIIDGQSIAHDTFQVTGNTVSGWIPADDSDPYYRRLWLQVTDGTYATNSYIDVHFDIPEEFTMLKSYSETAGIDSDGDSVPDTDDPFPDDPLASLDEDNDGVPDSSDPDPSDPAIYQGVNILSSDGAIVGTNETFTNSRLYTLQGKASDGSSKVKIVFVPLNTNVGDPFVEHTTSGCERVFWPETDEDGEFSIDLQLLPGENSIKVFSATSIDEQIKAFCIPPSTLFIDFVPEACPRGCPLGTDDDDDEEGGGPCVIEWGVYDIFGITGSGWHERDVHETFVEDYAWYQIVNAFAGFNVAACWPYGVGEVTVRGIGDAISTRWGGGHPCPKLVDRIEVTSIAQHSYEEGFSGAIGCYDVTGHKGYRDASVPGFKDPRPSTGLRPGNPDYRYYQLNTIESLTEDRILYLEEHESTKINMYGWWSMNWDVDQAEKDAARDGIKVGIGYNVDTNGTFHGPPNYYKLDVNDYDAEEKDSEKIIEIYVYDVDLDIDSDNDGRIGGSGLEDVSDLEDTMEDISRPGKVIAVNDNDKDSDGIPGFADGYTLAAVPDPRGDISWREEDTTCAGTGSMVELRLEWPCRWRDWMWDMEAGTWKDGKSYVVKFTYDDNDPKNVERTGEYPDYVYNMTDGEGGPDTGALRIWTNRNYTRNGESIEDGGDFIPSDLEFDLKKLSFYDYENLDTETLYVEGVNPTLDSHVIKVQVEVKDGGTTVMTLTDEVRVSAVQIKLYRDENYAKTLDDWATAYKAGYNGYSQVDTDYPRSPKFIFGERDPIYVEVAGLELSPGKKDTLFSDEGGVRVEVSSSNSSTNLFVKETENNSCVYRNESDLIYLRSEIKEGDPPNYIPVVNEDVLGFSLQKFVNPLKTVTIDLGEYLAIAGSESVKPGEDSIEPIVNEAILRVSDHKVDTYGWKGSGFMPSRTYVGTKAKNNYTMESYNYEYSKLLAWTNGNEQNYSSCADSLFYIGHGLHDISFFHDPELFSAAVLSWSGINGALGWPQDCEFIFIMACNYFDKPPATFSPTDPFWGEVLYWVKKMGQKNPLFQGGIHAVLATCDDVVIGGLGDAQNDFDQFLKNSESGDTVVEAWKEACYNGKNTPYGILVREVHETDCLKVPLSEVEDFQVTRDSHSTQCLFKYYYYKNKSYDIDGTTLASAARTNVSVPDLINEIVSFKGVSEIEMPSFMNAPDCSWIIDKKAKGIFDYIDFSNNKIRLSNNAVAERNGKHRNSTKEQRLLELLDSHGLSLPAGYNLVSRGEMSALSFSVDQEENVSVIDSEWVEGEVLKFCRFHKGRRVLSDACTVAVCNNDILSFDLKYNRFGGSSTQSIRNISVDSSRLGIPSSKVKVSLAFGNKGGAVIPVWEVRYQSHVIRYNALTGRPYSDED